MKIYDDINDPILKYFLNPDKNENNKFLNAIVNQNIKKLDTIFSLSEKEGINAFSYLPGDTRKSNPIVSIIKLINKVHEDKVEPESIHKWIAYLEKNDFNLLYKEFSVIYSKNNTFNNYDFEKSLAFIQKAEKLIDKIMAISEQDKHAASLLIESVLLDILTSSDKLSCPTTINKIIG